MEASGAIISSTVRSCMTRSSCCIFKNSPSLQSTILSMVYFDPNYVILERYIGSSGVARKTEEVGVGENSVCLFDLVLLCWG